MFTEGCSYLHRGGERRPRDLSAGSKQGKKEGKQEGKQASREAVGRHSVGAMPWRGLLILNIQYFLVDESMPRRILLFIVFLLLTSCSAYTNRFIVDNTYVYYINQFKILVLSLKMKTTRKGIPHLIFGCYSHFLA